MVTAVEGYDHVRDEPVTLTPKQWQALIEETVKAGGIVRILGEEAFLLDRNGQIVAEAHGDITETGAVDVKESDPRSHHMAEKSSEAPRTRVAGKSSAETTTTTRLNEVVAHSVSRPELSHEEREQRIRDRAYARAEARGFAPGAEWEDWLAAEREVDS